MTPGDSHPSHDFDALHAGLVGGQPESEAVSLASRSGSKFVVDVTYDAARGYDFRASDWDQQPEGFVEKFEFDRLTENSIHAAIANVDAWLTPHCGLRRVGENGRLQPVTTTLSGSALLIVHGTFSSGEAMIESVAGWMLPDALARYDHVLAFDYPSLSRSPLANALTLRRLLAPHALSDMAVVSHSQGGLVVRCWLELLDPSRRHTTRSLFATGTLVGTSLAAPRHLRVALRHFANLGYVMKVGSAALAMGIPAFGTAASVFAILQQALQVASWLPVADAAIAAVPGLLGMSMTRNNEVLSELVHATPSVPDDYYALAVRFEPDGNLPWLERIGFGIADAGMDQVFPGEHDLITDTLSHRTLADGQHIPDARVHTLSGSQAHHGTCFEPEAARQFVHGVLVGHRG